MKKSINFAINRTNYEMRKYLENLINSANIQGQPVVLKDKVDSFTIIADEEVIDQLMETTYSLAHLTTVSYC